MLIRVRTAQGQFRFEVATDINELAKLINTELKYDEFKLSIDPKGHQPVTHLQHGMQVYLHSDIEIVPKSITKVQKQTLEDKALEMSLMDQKLWIEDGLVNQPKSSMCRHGDLGKCAYCAPLSPFDESYLSKNNIKHLSFHSYLKKLKADQPEFIVHLLEEQVIKAGESTKLASTSTLSSTVTLSRQKFRMVDHCEFETHDMVDKYLKAWRNTGTQRFGWLIGYYAPYDQVALGLKAVVTSIYEPAQQGFVDGVQVYYLPGAPVTTDESKHAKSEFDQLQQLCSLLNLEIIGSITTDLKDDSGKVVYKRHINSHFLSAQECLLAATLQNQFYYKSPFSATGKFNSRFITCIASGNKDGGIEIEAYQVSSACMSMQENDLILPTFSPNYMMLKPVDQKPTLQYSYVDKYGNAVSGVADPAFPIEYMLITLSHGFPSTANTWFKSTKYFPIENRITEPQDPSTLRALFQSESLFYDLSNIHVLMFMIKMSLIDDTTLKLIVKVVKSPHDDSGMALLNSPGWQTFEMLIQEF